METIQTLLRQATEAYNKACIKLQIFLGGIYDNFLDVVFQIYILLKKNAILYVRFYCVYLSKTVS